jgi:peptide/nickel transport system permease protein
MRQRLRGFPWASILVLVALSAIATAPAVFPLDPLEQRIPDRLLPPGARGSDGHWFPLGSDALGRDVLARLAHGARFSLLVAGVAVLGSGGIGLTVGLVSGYVGGWVDRVLMRLVDLQLAFPFMILAIGVLAAVGPSLTVVIILFIFARWPAFARIVRGATLEVREREFVSAARALGARPLRIVLLHVAPSCLGPLLVLASFETASIIISEASLGFLGVGIPPPTPTWGNMLASGRAHLRTAWWLVVFPGLVISVVALAANLVGDAVRDYLDPKTRRRAG